METKKIEGFLTALTPIFHGGDEKTGQETLLRRMKWIVHGKPEEIPYVEGNAIRGYLRRLIMEDFLNQVEYETKTPRLYHCLFAGGVLEEVSEQATGKLDLALRRNIRAFLPPLSLLGGSIANQAFSGKLVVGKALPVCAELNEYLPVNSELSIYTFLTFSFATRRAEREGPEQPQKKGKNKKENPTVQMIYRHECFVPGTKFYHWFTLLDTTEIEKSCFARMIRLWRERPYIGGRSATGSGEIKIGYEIPYDEEPYLKFLKERKKEIQETLASLERL